MIGVIDKSSRSACKIDHFVRDGVQVKVNGPTTQSGPMAQNGPKWAVRPRGLDIFLGLGSRSRDNDQSIPNFADIAFVSASPISANIQFVSCSFSDLYKLATSYSDL